ncbi:hemoblobin-interacting domain-containing protein [Neobacillus drentensis]|uniref:hemoblobin-interacting domain-containing protein n=1 Tax=Neobacillus drentensis TaxID=220684 RepID=UPI002FFECC80
MNKYPYSKKFLSATLSLGLLVSPIAGSHFVQTATAATVTNSNVELTITNGKGAALSGTTVKLYDSANKEITLSAATTKYSASNLKAGDYTLVVSDTKVKMTSKLKVSGTTFKKNIVFASSASVIDPSKLGAIGGVLFDSTDNLVKDAPAIKVQDATTTWETSSDSKGSFKIFVPAGSYKLYVIGQDISDNPETDENESVDYKNNVYDVKVTAGVTSSPLEDLNPKQEWTVNENKLGYDKLTFGTAIEKKTINDLANTTKEIKGTALNDSTVYLYTVAEVKDNEGKVISTNLNQVTSAKVVNNKTTGIGNFALKLSNVMPGKKLAIKVVDAAGNEYLDVMSSSIPKLSMTVTPLDALYGKDVVITLSDANKLMTTANTAVTVGTGEEAVTLNNTQYSIVSGKLTIKANALNLGSNTITLKNDGFNDVVLTQKLIEGTVQALTVTASSSKLTEVGTTQVTATGVASGNKVQYKVSNTPVAAPKAGADVTSLELIDLPVNKIISDVDAVNNKYIGVYEIDKNDRVVKFKLIILTAVSVKTETTAPTLSTAATYAADKKVVTLTFSENIFKTGTTDSALKSAVKFAANGTTFAALKTGDKVAISGKTLVITFETALSGNTNKIQIAANAVQDKFANKIATALTTGALTQELEAVKSTVTTLTSSDSLIVIEGTVVKVPDGIKAGALKAALLVDGGKGNFIINNEALGEADAEELVSEYMTINTTAEDTSKTAEYTITLVTAP